MTAPLNKISIKIETFVDLEDVTKVPLTHIKSVVRNKTKYYGTKEKSIKGKLRILHWAKGENREIQTNLKKYFEKNILWPPFIHGWAKHKNQKTNVTQHLKKKYVLSLDIKDYFPSINLMMVANTLASCGVKEEVARLIAQLCTYEGILPHGLETSNYIANLVFLPIDFRINNFCKKHHLTYTRYGDDLAISGSRELYPYVGTIIKYIRQGGFILSKEKTSLRGRNKPQIVIKTIVNDRPRPQTEFISMLKREIRNAWSPAGIKELSRKYNKSPVQLKQMFWGRLSYIKQFNKKLYREIRGLLARADFKAF